METSARKLDTAAQRNMQHGGDPMDVGAVHDHWNYKWDEKEIHAVGYYGYTGQGKSKGKGLRGTSGGSQGQGKLEKGKVKEGF